MKKNTTNKKNISRLIKKNETVYRHAKYRLLGGIFLLILLTIPLVYITYRTKPPIITPDEVIIQRTKPVVNYHDVISQNNEAPVAVQSSQPITVSKKPDIEKNINEVISSLNEQDSISVLDNIEPQVVLENTMVKASPEDILQGNEDSKQVKRYFVVLQHSKDKELIDTLKQHLLSSGYKKVIITQDGGQYTIKLGPFVNANSANKLVSQLLHEG